MIKIKRLYMKDFVSFSEQEYSFVQGVPYLIQGKNETDKGQESNGSGKTVIQSAVEYCLLAYTSRKVVDKKLVRRGCKEAELELEMYCTQRKQTFVIHRSLYTKGSSKLDISINGEPAKFANVNDGNDLINKWIAIDKEDLSNFFIVNKIRYTPFFNMSNTKKLDLISRFSDSRIINPVFENLKKEIGSIEGDIENAQSDLDRKNGRLEEVQEQLEQEKFVDVENIRQEKIDAQEAKITTYRGEIQGCKDDVEEEKKGLKDFESDFEENQGIIDNLKKDLNNVQNSSLESIKKEIEEKRGDKSVLHSKKEAIEKQVSEVNSIINTINSNISSFKQEVSALNKRISGLIECPSCHFKFSLDDGTSEDELLSKISDTEAKIKEKEDTKESSNKIIPVLKQKQSSIESKISEYNSDIKEKENVLQSHYNKIELIRGKIEEEQKNIQSLQSGLDSSKRRIENLLSNIESNQEKIDNCKEYIEEIKQEKIETKEKELKERISEIKKSVKKSEQAIEETRLELSSKQEWLFNFTKFKSFLAGKCLLSIQGWANKFLDAMDTDIRIHIEGFKQKSDGTLSEKITPYVIRDGEILDYGEFSNGERAKIDFAMLLTNQEMINASHKYGGFDFLWCDEVVEGLDAMGLSNLMASLEGIHKTILITTHVVNNQLSENIILVKKVNHISKIV